MLERKDISNELWREYEFGGKIYRIDNPKLLFIRVPDGTTHRVLDDKGVVHCFPIPGAHGCVLRWKPSNPEKPVDF